MGHGWAKLKKTKEDCIRVNLENVSPTFSSLSGFVYMKMSFIMLGNHPPLLFGCYFADNSDNLKFKTQKIKYHDLAHVKDFCPLG